MPRTRAVYACQQCGHESPRWLGRCPECGEWNTFVEEVERREGGTRTFLPRELTADSPRPLVEVSSQEVERYRTGFGELDRVLGGGVVPGSLVLLGGDPGIGKSTLLLQVSNHISSHRETVLYVSGEESPTQTRMRADRLGPLADRLLVMSESNLETICQHIGASGARLVVVDSIQSVYLSALDSPPGSVAQVRECAGTLLRLAKGQGVAVLLVGHVTKAGELAGPRVLEHAVDTVLYFEGERHQSYRILRGVKNRFGSCHEIGIFEMSEAGLVEVPNPSQVLLAERPEGAAGSVVVSTLEGTRPILVEIQALVGPATLGIPRRTASGVDQSRVALLLAVLEKRCGLHLSDHDAFLKITGGVHVEEPAVDLGIAVALASSFREIPADSGTVVVGEVGLAGEIRSVNRLEQRLREAVRMGFRRCVVPAVGLNLAIPGLEVVAVRTLDEALGAVLV